MAPAAGLGLLALGAGAVAFDAWLRRQLQQRQKDYGENQPQDAFNRKLDLRRMNGRQLLEVQRLLEGKKDGYWRDPLTGVGVSGADVQKELLRRSGGGGFLFIAPAAPVVTKLAAESALIAAGYMAFTLQEWLKQKGVDWGKYATRGQKYGPADPGMPDWYPTGTFSESGTNRWYIPYVVLVRQSHTGCQVVEQPHRDAYIEFTGRPTAFDMRFTLDRPNTSLCGPTVDRTVEYSVWGVGNKLLGRGGPSVTNAYDLILERGRVVPLDGLQPALPVPNSAPVWLPGVGLPELEPLPLEVQPSRLVPLPRRPAVPAAPTVPGPAVPPAPDADPDASPGRPAPGPLVTPKPGTVPVPVPSPIPGQRPVLPGGAVAAPKPLPVPVTPPESVIPWPGAKPIGTPGQQPRPDLVGIAQEVGKIERKLELMNTPPGPLPPGFDLDQVQGIAGLLWNLFLGATDGGEYKIWSPCLPAGEAGSSTDPLVQQWGGSFGQFGGIEKRLDAIAGLLQDAKVLPQPTCRKPVIEGEWVTVQFESDEVSPAGEKRLRKTFRYRDQNNAPLEDHVTHWRDFSWQAGPTCVIHSGGVWGVPQVWAATADEGKRVIRHAAAIAGVDLDAPPGKWIVTGSGDPRVGMPGTMRVMRGKDFLWRISKRPGPSGPATYLKPAP